MKKITIFLLSTVLLTGCADHENLFDENKVKEEAKENFPVKDIDPNQTWNMMGVRTLDVTVNEKAGETYTIKVFSDNPLKENNDAHLLATAKVKNGETANVKFDAPLVMDYVYVMRQAAENDCVVTVAAIDNGRFVASFGEAVSRAATRASAIEIEGLPTDAEFICPATAEEVDKNIGDNLSGDYFIKGSVSTNKLNLSEQARLYVPSGATLIITKKNFSLNSGTIIVCEGGTLQYTGNEAFTLHGGSIYNKGNILLTGAQCSMDNKSSRFINNAALQVNMDEFVVSAGQFYNGSGAQVAAYKTIISSEGSNEGNNNQSECTWVNDGLYNGYEFYVTSGDRIQNNCTIAIREYEGSEEDAVFSLEHQGKGQNVVFNNAGYITCGRAVLDYAELNMAGSSVLEAVHSVELGNCSVVGVAGEKMPLLWVNAAKYKGDKQPKFFINEYVYVSCNNDFFNEMSGIKLVKATVSTEPTSNCTRSYETEEPEEEPAIAEYTYAFEDITVKAGDYDFNDVVLRVSNPINNEITVTLVAAGAMNDLWVCYDFGSGHKGELFDGKEVHAVFGEPAGTLINTDGTPTVAEQKCTLKDLPEGFSLTENGDIYIVDKHGVEVHVDVHIGDVPYALCVPGSWEYPEERVSITTKYPEFGIWGQNANNSLDWYLPSKARK